MCITNSETGHEHLWLLLLKYRLVVFLVGPSQDDFDLLWDLAGSRCLRSEIFVLSDPIGVFRVFLFTKPFLYEYLGVLLRLL